VHSDLQVDTSLEILQKTPNVSRSSDVSGDQTFADLWTMVAGVSAATQMKEF
jgi:hypothetical protein